MTCKYWREIDTEYGTDEYCNKLNNMVACCGEASECEISPDEQDEDFKALDGQI